MIAYLDCSTGISGDKFLGALVDAGFDIAGLRTALRDLGLTEVRVTTRTIDSHGVRAVSVSVTEDRAPRRHWRDVRPLLEAATLPATVRDHALAAFRALAEAEASVHGVDVDDVHFHELGAADTIADILGVALGIHELGIELLEVSPVAVGSGTVTTEHGELSVPAPATALMLEGVPIASGPASGELTTPTGAALLRAFASGYGPVPAMVLRRVGTGAGTRSLSAPNVCRLLIGEVDEPQPGREDVTVLESNIDHLTPEELSAAAARLRDAGALDVWQTPVLMKKGRAGTVLSAVTLASDAAAFAERMIAETGTLGVRIVPAERRLVERDVREVQTTLGPVRFKVALLPDGTRALRVEHDDAARIAEEHGLAVDVAAARLEAEASSTLGVQAMRQRPSSQTANPSD